MRIPVPKMGNNGKIRAGKVSSRARPQDNCERNLFIFLGMAMSSSVPLHTSCLKPRDTKKVCMYNTNRYSVSAKGQKLSDWIFKSKSIFCS